MDFPILIVWTSPLQFFSGTRSHLSFLFHFSTKIIISKHLSHLGLFCLPMSNKKDARLIWAKIHCGNRIWSYDWSAPLYVRLQIINTGFISMRLRIENSSSIGVTLAPMTTHANNKKSLITRVFLRILPL